MEHILRRSRGSDTEWLHRWQHAGAHLRGSEDRAHRHAEAVRVIFDPTRLAYATLLEEWFFRMPRPTTLDRQGNDLRDAVTDRRSSSWTRSSRRVRRGGPRARSARAGASRADRHRERGRRALHPRRCLPPRLSRAEPRRVHLSLPPRLSPLLRRGTARPSSVLHAGVGADQVGSAGAGDLTAADRHWKRSVAETVARALGGVRCSSSPQAIELARRRRSASSPITLYRPASEAPMIRAETTGRT
jgi:hypothetical protein